MIVVDRTSVDIGHWCFDSGLRLDRTAPERGRNGHGPDQTAQDVGHSQSDHFLRGIRLLTTSFHQQKKTKNKKRKTEKKLRN